MLHLTSTFPIQLVVSLNTQNHVCFFRSLRLFQVFFSCNVLDQWCLYPTSCFPRVGNDLTASKKLIDHNRFLLESRPYKEGFDWGGGGGGTIFFLFHNPLLRPRLIRLAWQSSSQNKRWPSPCFPKRGPCALHHWINTSLEAILACHPAVSTEWLAGWHFPRTLWLCARPPSSL